VWDWSGAVTQSPTSGCYAYRPGRAHEVFWTWPWGAPGCMPEPGALLFRRDSAVATSRAGQGDADGRRLSLPSQLDRLINLHSDGLFGVTLRTHGNRKQAARRHLGAARARDPSLD